MNTISLCCTTQNTNLKYLRQMLESAQGFDERLIHFNQGQISSLCYDFKVQPLCKRESLTAAQGFNFVIRNAMSSWICPVCDDDFFHRDNLSELMSWFHSTEIKEDIIRFPTFGGNENIGWTEGIHAEPTYEGLREQNMLPFSCFYRKSLWEKVGGYDDLPYNDWHLWMKTFKLGASVYTWNKPIYYFRSGIEERASDKETKTFGFEAIRTMLLENVDARFNA